MQLVWPLPLVFWLIQLYHGRKGLVLLDAAARRIMKTVAAECETRGGVVLEGDVRPVLICWLS